MFLMKKPVDDEEFSNDEGDFEEDDDTEEDDFGDE